MNNEIGIATAFVLTITFFCLAIALQGFEINDLEEDIADIEEQNNTKDCAVGQETQCLDPESAWFGCDFEARQCYNHCSFKGDA